MKTLISESKLYYDSRTPTIGSDLHCDVRTPTVGSDLNDRVGGDLARTLARTMVTKEC